MKHITLENIWRNCFRNIEYINLLNPCAVLLSNRFFNGFSLFE